MRQETVRKCKEDLKNLKQIQVKHRMARSREGGDMYENKGEA
jgi:hypothetical protein